MAAHTSLLVPHPGHPRTRMDEITVQAARDGASLRLVYKLSGNTSSMALPSPTGGARRDELWKQTCFEAFIRVDGADGYVEFNFAPNGDWAAYAFSGYRNGMRDLECPAPQIETTLRSDGLTITVQTPALPAEFATGQIWLGPSAIVEDKTGARSYWALHHPEDAPDFHHAENFKMRLD